MTKYSQSLRRLKDEEQELYKRLHMTQRSIARIESAYRVLIVKVRKVEDLKIGYEICKRNNNGETLKSIKKSLSKKTKMTHHRFNKCRHDYINAAKEVVSHQKDATDTMNIHRFKTLDELDERRMLTELFQTEDLYL